MSKETLDAIEKAIQDHINDIEDEPAVLRGYLVLYEDLRFDEVDGLDPETYSFEYISSPSGGPTLSLGLAARGHAFLAAQLNGQLDD